MERREENRRRLTLLLTCSTIHTPRWFLPPRFTLPPPTFPHIRCASFLPASLPSSPLFLPLRPSRQSGPCYASPRTHRHASQEIVSILFLFLSLSILPASASWPATTRSRAAPLTDCVQIIRGMAHNPGCPPPIPASRRAPGRHLAIFSIAGPRAKHPKSPATRDLGSRTRSNPVRGSNRVSSRRILRSTGRR